MTYRIGIFDPAFRPEGHFIPFNRYLAEVLETPGIEVTFIDQDGQVQTAFEKLQETRSYLRLPEVPRPPRLLPVRAGRILSRYLFWRSAFSTMKKADLDLVLFTADARDIIMCIPAMLVPYAAIILYPYAYVPEGTPKSTGSFVQSFLYRRFLRKATVRFSTNEPPILRDIEKHVGLEGVTWIPDLPARERLSVQPEATDTFLTIGTISKSKNHLFVLDAFTEAALPFTYVIAGKPLDEVGAEVEARVKALSKTQGFAVEGRFGYLDEPTYMDLIQNAGFLIFPYDLTRGNISSQVLHDTFSTGTPIIAPDIEPFRWYVDKYGIGLLYKEGDATSFAETVRAAHATGRASFLPGFEKLRSDHSLEAIQKTFLAAIEPIRASAR